MRFQLCLIVKISLMDRHLTLVFEFSYLESSSFLILHSEKGQEVHENYFNDFSK